MGKNIILEQKATEWHNAVQVIQRKIEDYSEEAETFDELCMAMIQHSIKPNLWREEHFKRLSDLANQIASKDSDLATSLNTFVGVSQKYYSDISVWIPFQTTLKEHGWLSELEEKYQEEYQKELAWEAEQNENSKNNVAVKKLKNKSKSIAKRNIKRRNKNMKNEDVKKKKNKKKEKEKKIFSR